MWGNSEMAITDTQKRQKKDALGVKADLQSRSRSRKAQCHPVKPAFRITASFQSVYYNLPVAFPAPVPHFQSHVACVSLGTHFFHPPWSAQLLAQQASK